ncbi:NAD(P)-dependent oxidoreductase [Nocardioides sp.]|uniref:NAD-dependent epimerase/dehydratase family protein n=1 Tax=Nocardioides sp. TaxID=35761 RepID=UPI0027367B5C|nr:NAD(P)-dependent oxidoreductase [Nocardioides sp.]MDP3889996.1 NAD(P)-dependent oxidoreductase [Nocardioides sp.]
MRILLAGATGVIGRHLVPRLVGAGHEVVGSTRSLDRVAALEDAGAAPVQMDPLDVGSVLAAVEQAEPDVIVHQLTALAGGINPKRFDQDFAMTNRLRTEALDHLLAAARKMGVRRFVAQSFTGWTNPRSGGPVVDESAGLDPDPAPGARETLAAIAHVEEAVAGAEDLDGLVLRYGMLYGPGTAVARGGDMLESVARGKFPVVAGGRGVWSFVHVADAAAATVRAIEQGAVGIYNIVDDDPAPVAEWLPALAEAGGGSRPRAVPGWLARPMIGRHGLNMMTAARGASNARAKADLGWRPVHPSWREGFRTSLG